MKNLIVFYTDQLRKDVLGCYGNPIARTPNIDALAKRGVVFQNHYAANPVCSPSRASFMTGRYPQAHRLIDNGIALPETEITLPQVLAEHGYRTGSVGKHHLTPMAAPAHHRYAESWDFWATGALDDWTGPYYGFQDVKMTLGHGDNACLSGHYGRWARENFPTAVAGIEGDKGGYFGVCKLPVEAHHSTWVGDRAVEFVRENAGRPFCLYASFADPHAPFACPEPYLDMFRDAVFPPPNRREGENADKPEHYRVAMEKRQFPTDGDAHRPGMTDDEWRTVFAATYGMVSLIDANVGKVLEALRDAGLEDNTTIVFTSDHGDFLGDHWFLYKGPLPCKSLLNIPFIVADPNIAPRETHAVMSNVDAMPTLLQLIGADVPDCVQGRSMVDVMKGESGDEDHVALTSGWSKDSPRFYHHSIYTGKWRISYFPLQNDGELYDLERDPHEHENLYHKSEHKAVRDEMMLRLLGEIGRAEPKTLPVVAKW